MIAATSSPTVLLRRLEWDSAHFEFPVAELTAPDMRDEDLRGALSAARTEGVRLVYWATHWERKVAPDLLSEFHGAAVNHRVKFVAPLTALPQVGQHAHNERYRIGEFPRGPASTRLLQLSIVAGGHSRFQIDPRIPHDHFRRLYEIWMNRSTLRELADDVLVATPSDAPDEIIGVITLTETAGAGQIGLLAVHEVHRGRGVATLLMTAAHDWLRHRGATEMSVVTQLENHEACALYSRWNCETAEIRQWFHFWPRSAMEEKG